MNFFNFTVCKALLITSSFFILFLSQFQSQAQSEFDKECGVTYFEEMRQKRFPGRNLIMEFEQWMDHKQNERLENFGQIQLFANQEKIYKIPVVIHVLHKGESYGQGTNIPDEQILAQIDILNEDFRRQNEDAINTPERFLPVAADVGIEFVLAGTDPDGNPTNGIIRKQGTRNIWGQPNSQEISNNSFWPSEDYLNIWVADLTFGVIGWAQFPDSDLPGIEPSLGRTTDGVVIDYELFGTGGSARTTSLGRTATHEVGHFFGLRHTWGDGGCDVDDFCLDTPNMSSPSAGCDPERESCGEITMVQNYMDYSSDACMNLFTLDQKGRMLTVIENSPRRQSLLNSPGLIDANESFTDLSITSLISPDIATCENGFEATIRIRNIGTEPITSASISLYNNNSLVETHELTQVLASGAERIISYSPVFVTERGVQSLSFSIETVNGEVSDDQPENNALLHEINVPFRANLPVFETFSSFPANWSTYNPDKLFTWELNAAPAITPSNQAIALRFFTHGEVVIGATDYLLSPLLDFTTAEAPELFFRYAYAMKNEAFYEDEFKIIYSTDCGKTFPESNTLLHLKGSQLATASSRNNQFVPAGAQDWTSRTIDLSLLKGLSDIQIAFIGINGRGNNLYLDDIAILPDQTPQIDLSLTATTELKPIYCPGQIDFDIMISNLSPFDIKGIVINYQIGDQGFSENLNQLEIGASGVYNHTISANVGQIGIQDLNISVSPLEGSDIDFSNNLIASKFGVSTNTALTPYRDKIEGDFPDGWLSFSTQSDSQWELSVAPDQTPENEALKLGLFESNEPTNNYWLVSPAFDLSNLDEASFHFRLSYALNTIYENDIQVYAFKECSEEDGLLLWEKEWEELEEETEDNDEWIPNSQEDWENIYVSLNEIAGGGNYRLAIKVTSGNGNNLYIDNLELFIQDIAQPTRIPENSFYIYPNPTQSLLNIVFVRDERESIKMTLFDLSGIPYFEQFYPNTLNQTYTLDLTTIPMGMYILQIEGQGFKEVKRIVKN